MAKVLATYSCGVCRRFWQGSDLLARAADHVANQLARTSMFATSSLAILDDGSVRVRYHSIKHDHKPGDILNYQYAPLVRAAEDEESNFQYFTPEAAREFVAAMENQGYVSNNGPETVINRRKPRRTQDHKEKSCHRDKPNR